MTIPPLFKWGQTSCNNVFMQTRVGRNIAVKIPTPTKAIARDWNMTINIASKDGFNDLLLLN